ncbi:hypothetical protein AG1IA_05003 [Rhizoctonia solani AG-1 IA]|uniref:Uncharacterized protein n=1 Tax=Thanatephorus cucumeris (strain AG1-IA) TaxID=983506 RepID=L8WS57_THACA|nr:hypothetical protein AG1IA_05003 [Rhizoctonia solani AG-1 IA]
MELVQRPFHASCLSDRPLGVASVKRKKCDETKPKYIRWVLTVPKSIRLIKKLLRCTKRGEECEYDYIKTSTNKKRTRPAPRPASEIANKAIEHISDFIRAEEYVNATTTPNGLTRIFDHSPVPLSDSALSSDASWEPTFYQSTLPITLPFSNARTTRATDSSPLVCQQLVESKQLTQSQASLLDALLSLGDTNSPEQNIPSNSTLTIYSAPTPVSYCSLSGPLGSNSYRPIASAHIPRIDKHEEDERDIEGIGQIICRTPARLDPMIDSNSLMFVLHSYSQWMSLAVFDPLKAATKTYEDITSRFSECPTTRRRLVLVSEVMRKLIKSWSLDAAGKEMLSSLRDQIWQNVRGYRVQQLPSSEERKRATTALDQVIEVFDIGPRPSLSTLMGGRGHEYHNGQTAFMQRRGNRYYIPWSLELCNEFTQRRGAQGTRWMVGLPDQLIMLFAYMNGLREDAIAAGTRVDPKIVEQIEEDMKNMVIPPWEGKDPSLAIGRLVVQECWREAVCGADALDPRVEKAQRGFMKLAKAIKPGRNPDVFLATPMIIVSFDIPSPPAFSLCPSLPIQMRQ